MRFRRVRWVAITTVAATVVGVLAVGAEAYADRGAERCAPPSVQQATRHDGSWRTSAFRAAGCRAWRTMHPRHVPARSRR
jgi:hypothetical protein